MKAIGRQQVLNQRYLTDLLGKALGRTGLKVIDWKIKQVLGGMRMRATYSSCPPFGHA